MLSGTPSQDFCSQLGGPIVAGVDEAGRGPLAGPVVAAAVVLCKPRPGGLDDSKKLTAERRELLEDRIRRRCAFGIGVVHVEDIDRLNIFHATMLAMTLAMEELCRALGADCRLDPVAADDRPGRPAPFCTAAHRCQVAVDQSLPAIDP